MDESKEIPLIVNWRRRLPKMRGSYYCVDEVTSKFIDFTINETHQVVRISLVARYFDLKFEDIPEALRHWIPVTREGQVPYNHIAAEANRPASEFNLIPKPNDKPSEEEVITPIATPTEAEVTPREKLDSMIITFMQNMVKDMDQVQTSLNNAKLSIKDPKSGEAGKNFINQASQIANLNDKIIKGKLAVLQGFQLLNKILDNDKKNNKKDGKTDNSNKKD